MLQTCVRFQEGRRKKWWGNETTRFIGILTHRLHIRFIFPVSKRRLWNVGQLVRVTIHDKSGSRLLLLLYFPMTFVRSMAFKSLLPSNVLLPRCSSILISIVPKQGEGMHGFELMKFNEVKHRPKNYVRCVWVSCSIKTVTCEKGSSGIFPKYNIIT